MSIVCTVPPTQTPIGLDEVKTRLKVDFNDEDTLLDQYLKSAVDYAQEYQWSQLCTATYVERFDCFPCVFKLQRNPVQSVTSVAYVDTAGVTQTLTANTDYTVDVYSKPCRIVPAFGKYWPTTRGHVNDVTVTYVAGYGEPSDVPDNVKMALLLKVDQQRSSCEDPTGLDKPIHGYLDKQSFRVFY